MNRQQRRLMARQKETESRHLQYLEQRQKEKMDASLDFFAVSIALAHHDVYPDSDDKIADFIAAWNNHVRRIIENEVTFPELQRELEAKTQITFTISD